MTKTVEQFEQAFKLITDDFCKKMIALSEELQLSIAPILAELEQSDISQNIKKAIVVQVFKDIEAPTL